MVRQNLKTLVLEENYFWRLKEIITENKMSIKEFLHNFIDVYEGELKENFEQKIREKQEQKRLQKIEEKELQNQSKKVSKKQEKLI